MEEFTHLDENGRAQMVDVSTKPETDRIATASGRIRMSKDCFVAVRSQQVQKGDVLAAARIAGIMGAKRTSDLIPLCHQLPLTHAAIDFVMHEALCEIEARCTTQCTYATGVEMEALTAVSVALLTIYDMCKALDRSMEIRDIRLEYKAGGRSGVYEQGADV